MSNPTITRDAWAWAQECSRRAATAGIAFEFDPSVPGPCTDGATVRVPPLPADATADDFTILRGAVIHECGHILRREAFDIMERERVAMGSPLWACFNIVEDAAQERASAARWLGDRVNLAAMHATILRRQLADARNAEPAGPVSEDAPKLAGALGVSLLSAGDWSPEMATMAEQHARGIDARLPGTFDTFDALRAEGWQDRIAALTDVNSAWELARALYARLFPNKPESENKDGQQQAKPGPGPCKPKGAGGKPQPAQQPQPQEAGQQPQLGEGDADGEPEDGDGEGEPQPGTVPWQLIFHSDHDSDALGVPCPSRIDWSGKTSMGAPAFFPSQDTERPEPTATDTRNAARLKFPAALVATVRRMLQAKARVRWAHEKLDGRIDARNLQRVILPRVGDGTYNKQVFRKRDESLALDCAVTILVDSSGSMSGAKYVAAAESAMCLFDLCAAALRVPVEVLGFTTSGRDGPVYFTFKTFAERTGNREQVAARMLAVDAGRTSHGMACNADGDAILWAASRLRARRESRKVIIVLSDGSPSSHVSGSDADSNLAAAIRAVRARGECEVYGIGIQDVNVRRYYSPTAPVVNRPEDVPQALIDVLGDVLQRGARR